MLKWCSRSIQVKVNWQHLCVMSTVVDSNSIFTLFIYQNIFILGNFYFTTFQSLIYKFFSGTFNTNINSLLFELRKSRHSPGLNTIVRFVNKSLFWVYSFQGICWISLQQVLNDSLVNLTCSCLSDSVKYDCAKLINSGLSISTFTFDIYDTIFNVL